MRERLALLVCGLTLLLVAGLSWLFAVRHNPRGDAPVPARTAAPPPVESAGLRLFREQGCTNCHALGGSGNPRSPLDGVAARLDRAALYAWITGTGAAAEQLATSVVRRKERYRELPEADMKALIDALVANGGVPR